MPSTIAARDSREITVTKLRLKRENDGLASRDGEPSLLDGRSAAVAKTASKAERTKPGFIRNHMALEDVYAWLGAVRMRCCTCTKSRTTVAASASTVAHAAPAMPQRGISSRFNATLLPRPTAVVTSSRRSRLVAMAAACRIQVLKTKSAPP